MNLEIFKTLRCPSCGQDGQAYGNESLTVTEHLHKHTEVSCGRCGDHGTLAYFTPATPPVERIISREIGVDAGRDDLAHAKAMTAAIDLFVRAAGEEGLDIRWETLRMAAARDEETGGVTFVAVVKTWERRHARDASEFKLIKPADLGGPSMKSEYLYEMGFISTQESSNLIKNIKITGVS